MSNSNVAFKQGGNALQIGYRDLTEPSEFQYDEIRTVLKGGLNQDYVPFHDDFLGDLLADEWAADLSTGASAAINAAAQGTVRLATDTDSGDHATLALGLHWLVSTGYTFLEVGIKQVSAITLRTVEVGLSDALSETNGLAFSGYATPTAVATNAAVFHYNTGDSMTTWGTISVNAGGTPQTADITAAPSASAYSRLGLLVDSAGNARFYVAGVLVATHALAVATTSLFTPWISLQSTSGAIKTMDVDYVSIYGARA